MREYTIDEHLIPFNDKTDQKLPQVLGVNLLSNDPIEYLVTSCNQQKLGWETDLTGKRVNNREMLERLSSTGLNHLRYRRIEDKIEVYYKENWEEH